MLPALLLPLVAFTTTAFAVPTSHPVEKRTNPITTTNGYVSPGPYGLCIKDSVHERVLNKAYFGDHEHMTHGRCSDFCFVRPSRRSRSSCAQLTSRASLTEQGPQHLWC